MIQLHAVQIIQYHILNVFALLFCLCSFCYFLLVLFLGPFGFLVFLGSLRTGKNSKTRSRKQRRKEAEGGCEKPANVLMKESLCEALFYIWRTTKKYGRMTLGIVMPNFDELCILFILFCFVFFLTSRAVFQLSQGRVGLSGATSGGGAAM